MTLKKAFIKYLGIQNFILWQSQKIIKRLDFFSPTFVWPLPMGHTSCDHLEQSSVIGWGGFVVLLPLLEKWKGLILNMRLKLFSQIRL